MAVPPPTGVETYPASLSQRRLWFLNQLQSPSAAYNVHVGLWLYGPLDIAVLQRGLQAIVDRHETLRTSFALEGGELVQRVLPTYSVSLPVTDFSHFENPYPPAYEFAKREVGTIFDLAEAPLFRSQLMRIAPEEHVLLCTMHHTITDAWSMQAFTRELASLYDAWTTGRTPQLPELAIQYGDYSVWQRDLVETESSQQQLSYWKERLADAPPLLELAKDRPRPAEQTFEGATWTFALPPEIITGALALAKQFQVTPFMLLLAAFKVLLYRYSGQPDVLVGVPVAGRTQVETESLIGFFVDTLVLRDDLSGNPRFLDLLAQVRETTLGALANADVPFERVVEALRPERNLSYNPVFQVMFSQIQSAIRSHAFGNVVAYPYVVNSNTSILDLCATFIEDSDRKWWLQFDFNTALFTQERISQLFDHYTTVLREITIRPEIQIDDLPLPKLSRPAAVVPPQKKEVRKRNARALAAKSNTKSTLPADPEQALLLEIWKDVLGVQHIGVQDNFFDLGGHSLLAARLVGQIQEATGRALRVSAIFRAPTIESLAVLLREDAVSQPDPVAMPLRQGDSGVPFFAVVAPGADSLGYALLARHLGDRDSMYKLQGPGPGVWGRPFRKDELRQLAQEYIRAMRAVQPHGPYCVGGMCDGVLIAQEMVLALESLGEEVACFAILDTWVLENSQIRTLWAIDYYRERLRMFRSSPLKQRIDTIQRTVKRVATRDNSTSVGWAQAYWPGPEFEEPRFHAPVILFKRPRQPYYYVRDPQMGWGARSKGGVEICELHCGHYELLRPPYVGIIGQRLSARLREINDRAKQSTLLVPEKTITVPIGDMSSGLPQFSI
ncbi:MAG TPA: condensation domain-containing protein [Candidatus Sulfotelmatobacter sp.]|nr:condensation domain-containing protein [Candidatus Sulfotelmatobacter sp.]